MVLEDEDLTEAGIEPGPDTDFVVEEAEQEHSRHTSVVVRTAAVAVGGIAGQAVSNT